MMLTAKSYNSRQLRVSQGTLLSSPQGHEQGDGVDLGQQYFMPRWSVSDNGDKESPSARGRLAHLNRGEMVFANLSSNSLYSRISSHQLKTILQERSRLNIYKAEM